MTFKPSDSHGSARKVLGQETGGDNAQKAAEAFEILAMIAEAEGAYLPENLNGTDWNFLSDMMGKHKQYGAGLQVSGRQLFWLRDIKDKLILAGVL